MEHIFKFFFLSMFHRHGELPVGTTAVSFRVQGIQTLGTYSTTTTAPPLSHPNRELDPKHGSQLQTSAHKDASVVEAT